MCTVREYPQCYTDRMQYTAQKFDIPKLTGISDKQIEVHVGLYEGYVKHINLLREQITDLTALDKEKYAYAVTETRRRLGFEFNGMRMRSPKNTPHGKDSLNTSKQSA